MRAQPVVVGAGVGLGMLSAAAAWADGANGVPAVGVVVDVAVGLVLAGAGLTAVGSTVERWLVASVGAAWLVGSVFAATRSLHQSVLLFALLAFPSGRIRGVARMLLTVPTAAVALQVVPQLGIAALFAVITPLALLGVPRWRGAFPAAAGGAMAGALLFAWWAGRNDALVAPVLVYEVALIMVAVGFVAATRGLRRYAARLADVAIGGEPEAGIVGLKAVLAELLGDPGLRIDLWDTATDGFLDPVTGTAQPVDIPSVLLVRVDGARAARVVTTASAMSDPPTAAAVSRAVGLAVANHRLRAAHQQHVDELVASRQRLLAATDRERDRAAGALRTDVIAVLDRAAVVLARRDPGAESDLDALLDAAAAGINVATADVRRIVGGAPPSVLGEGRLREAVESLAAASHVPAGVTITSVPPADVVVETALFYVCSEALTNVAKHGHAGRAWIDLRHEAGQLRLEVGDDGRGGADPHGSGLQGLADRLAAHGGRLTVISPTGRGTVVTATIPLRPADGTMPARPVGPAATTQPP
jgi:signal transduction histidine kinase